MNDYRKQIKQHQEAVERLNAQLPELQRASSDALAAFSNSRVNRSPYPQKVVDALSLAKSALDGHRQEIARLLKLAEWEEGQTHAPSVIKTARKAMAATGAELLELQGQRIKVADKLTKLQASQRSELADAEAAERSAAAQYAAASIAGDGSAETRAKSALDSVAGVFESLKRGRSGVTAVVQALTGELEKLDERLEDARQRQEQARRDLLCAARYLWAGRLEQAASEVTRIAAHVAATEKALGWHSSMDDICVPLLTPTGIRALGRRDVNAIATRLGIEQLSAA